MAGAVGVATLTVLALAGGPIHAADTGATSAARIAVERATRQQLGLPSDLATVSALQTDATADHTYGFAASASEATEMARRIRIQDGLTPLTTFLEGQPDFGGLYLDQAAGAVVDIAMVGNNIDLQARAKALAPSEAAVRFRTVTNSWATLQAQRATIRDAMALRAPEATAIVSARTNVEANVVEIAIDQSKDAGLTRATFEKAGLVAIVSSGPIAPTTACNTPLDCGQKPWRGGLAIRLRSSSSGYLCSTGLNLKAFNNLPGRWILTAGHCGAKDTDWEHTDALQTHLGPITANVLSSSTKADAAAIDINDGWGGNMVILQPGLMRNITSIQGHNGDSVGQYTCHDGVTTYTQVGGFVCGTLIDDDIDVTANDGFTRLESRRVQVRVAGGDSGTAVFTGSMALGGEWGGGITDGDHYDQMYYSHIFNITDLIGGPQNTVLVQTSPD